MNHLDLEDDNTIEFLENHFLNTNRELANQTTSNALLQSENQRLRAENRRYEARVSELERKLKSTEQRHDALQDSLNDTKSELHRMTREIERSAAQEESYQKLHKDWKKKYQNVVRERDDFLDRCKRLESELRDHKVDLDEERGNSNTLRTTLSETKNDLATIQQEQNEQIMEYNAQIESLHEQNNFLQDKVAKYKRKCKRLLERQRERAAHEGTLQEQLQAELNEALSSLSTTNSRLKQLTEKHNKVHMNHVKLTNDLQDKDSQIDLLKQEVSSLKSLVDQLQQYVNESDRTKEMLNREISLKDQQLKKRNDFIRKFISNVPLGAGGNGGANGRTPTSMTSPKSPLRFRSTGNLGDSMRSRNGTGRW